MHYAYVAHVWQQVDEVGPLWKCWQYPCERYIGILTPLIKNPNLPYASLANEIQKESQIALPLISTGTGSIYELKLNK